MDYKYKKSITKTVSLGNSSIMQRFVNEQSNFAKTIKFLIFDYCKRNGIRNISAEYDKMQEFSFEEYFKTEPENKEDGFSREAKPVHTDENIVREQKEVKKVQNKDEEDIPSCFL